MIEDNNIPSVDWREIVMDIHRALGIPFGENIYGTIENLLAHKEAHLKIAEIVGEEDDPFAAWESVHYLNRYHETNHHEV